MIDGALRVIAVVACAFIALSFLLFAVEQIHDASTAQQSAVVDPGGATEVQRARQHTKAREVVDDVDDQLLSPFAGIVPSHSRWVERGIPTLLGLLIYGVGLLYLARLLKVRSRRLPAYR